MGRILITDDNQHFRASFRSALVFYFPSIVIEEAANAREAIDRIDRQAPDMVFMDIHLPEMNGLELTRRIKTCHPEVSVTVFTGYDAPEYARAALDSGASHFLVKSSITADGIAALVASVLGEKGIAF